MDRGITFDDNKGPVTINNERLISRSTIIGKLIEIIASRNIENVNLDRIPADVEHKISFNNVERYKWLVQEYIGSSLLIDESIISLNQTIINGSTKLKRQMKLFYCQALSKYSISTSPFDVIKLKKHSDDIIQEVIELTGRFVRRSSDLKSGYFDEDIEFGVALLTSYSIIECVVLENPNDHS